MPLEDLHFLGTWVSDLVPLAEVSTLKWIQAERHAKSLPAIATRTTINDMSAAEFCRQVEAGQMN
jgi:hypothetical protein